MGTVVGILEWVQSVKMKTWKSQLILRIRGNIISMIECQLSNDVK